MLAVEPARPAVVRADRHAVVVADVGRLVGGEDQRLGDVDPAGADRAAVVEHRHVAALGQSATVVVELRAHLVGSGRDLLGRLDDELLQAEHVVDERRTAVLDVEAQPPNRPPCAMITPWVGPSAAAASAAVTLKERFLMSMTLFSDSRFMPGKSTCVVPVISCGRPAMRGVEALEAAVVDGQDVVLDRLDQPQPLQRRELLGHLRRQVVGLGPVARPVVELPHVVVERRQDLVGNHGVLCRVTALQPLW